MKRSGARFGARFAVFCFALGFAGALASPAWAACTNPVAAEGTVFYNEDQNTPQVCANDTWIALGALNPSAGSGSCSNPTMIEGSIVYNNDHDVLQYCDGTNWIAVQAAPAGGGGCTPPPAPCSSVGQVCTDGSIFAGFMVYGSSCEPLYVTDNNQSAASQWKTSSGTNDISTDDFVDGKVNAANRSGAIANFPVFDLCESNTYHGKSDWYLPSRAELNLLWLNRAAINANSAASFTGDIYWSSTEGDSSGAWNQHFFYGTQDYYGKTNSNDVRCVRRD